MNPLSTENWPLGWGIEGEGSQVCVNIATFNESNLDDVMFAITHIHGERTYPSTLPRGVFGSMDDSEGNAIVNDSLTSQYEETVNQLIEELNRNINGCAMINLKKIITLLGGAEYIVIPKNNLCSFKSIEYKFIKNINSYKIFQKNG